MNSTDQTIFPILLPSEASATRFNSFAAAYSRLSAQLGIVVSIAVLIGWVLDIAVLKSVVPGLPTMKFNTALGFLLCALSLWLLGPAAVGANSVDPRPNRWAQVCAGLVVLLGVATLSEYFFNIDLAIDELVILDRAAAVHTSYPGRMALATAFNFVFLGIALWCVDANDLGRKRAGECSAVAVLVFSWMALLGYAYGATPLYKLYAYTSVALHTAALFVILGLAALFARTGHGLIATMTGAYSGSVMARRVIPLAIVLTSTIGWLRLQGQLAGFYGTEFGLALFATSNITTFIVLVWMSARSLNRIDAERRHANEQLIEQSLVLDLAQVFVRDLDNRIVSWSSGAEKLYGFSKAEATGRISHELLATEFPVPLAQIHQELYRSGVWEGELTRRGRDGSRILISSQWVLHRDAAGSPLRILEANVNITERRSAEERFKLVVEAAPNAMITVNSAGKMTLVNAQAETLFGYDRQELIGQPIEILVPERFRTQHPEHRKGFFTDPKSRSMGAGRDLFGRRKDGSEMPIEIGLNPITSSEGPSVLASIIDITERKRAEERFRIAVEAAPNAMIMVSKDGKVVMVNFQTEKLFGYDRAQLIGQPIEMLVPERFRGKHPSHRTEFFTDPHSRTMGAGRDLYGLRQDGSEVPVEIGLNPIETSEGAFVLASIIDITERKRAEERFRLVVEAAPSSMIMVSKNGKMVMVNAQTENLFGYTREELIGQPIEILVPERFRSQHPEHRKGFFTDPKSRSMGAGRDLFGRRKDGSEMPIEIGLNPITTSEGPSVLASIIDITERRRAEATVRESEDRFRLMVEGVIDYSILMLDSSGHIASWNAGAQRMKGYSADEIMGKHFSCFYLPADISSGKPERELEIAAADGRFEDEGWRIRKDGSRFWANVVITAMRNEKGVLDGFSKMTRDLTQRKQAEEKFQLVVEASPIGMVMMSQAGVILLVNAQIEELFGYARAELLGQPIEVLVPVRFRGQHPGHRTEFFAAPSPRAMGVGRDLYGLRKDGSEFPVEIGLNPIETIEGKAVMASIIDITERKRAEERFRSVVEAAPSSMIMVNSEGKITLVNAQTENLFGYTRGELIGQTIEILVPERFRSQHPEHRKGFFADPKSRSMGAGRDLFGRRKDGSEMPIEIGLNPIRGPEGMSVLASIIDISERKKSEEEFRKRAEDLVRSNADLEQFAYIASHDLQEPLRAVAGCLNIFKRRYQSQIDARADELIGHATEGAERMQKLIEDLLAFSRVGTRTDEFAPVDCDKALAGAMRSLSVAISESGAVVTHDPLPMVSADLTQVTQLFQNLIGNGIKFKGNDSPHVHVSAQMNGKDWILSVRDNGIGIEPQYFERIFKIFQRLHTRNDYPGTGIGLAVCKKIVERHGGRLWIESRPGEGSTFYFNLPQCE